MESRTSLSLIKLVPTLPSFNNKDEVFVDRDTLTRTKSTIPSLTRFSGVVPDAARLPDGWYEHIHPEGNVYYHHPETKVVSGTDPRRAGVAVLFNKALETIRGRLPLDAKSDSPEIYLHMPDFSHVGPDGFMEYYLVDYDSRSIFWVEDVDIQTSLAGSASSVEPFESLRHLCSGLTPEFWTHVEYHPCHQSNYDHNAEKELTAVLRFGCVDDMTAPGSVFPYGADECSRYLSLLERFHGDDESTESYRRIWIARLWASICRTRHINRHGLPYSRVDRLQGLDSYLRQQTRRSVAIALGEAFCLGMSRWTFTQLTELWNGRIVYQRHWQPFLERQRSEWRWTALGGLYVLTMTAIQSAYATSLMPVVCSASFTCSAILVSALMLQKHSVERLRTASDISSYISATESFDHGLRPLSIAFALPKALLGYGILISAGNALLQCGLQPQADPAQLYRITAAAALPLLLVATLYHTYGPSAM